MRNAKILVTGGTGKTGGRLSQLLAQEGIAHDIASRNPSSSANSVRFDWTDPSTHIPALDGIGAVYLVAPTVEGDPAALMIDFCKTALAQGVTRFVLLSASLIPEGGPFMGQVHSWLKENTEDWAVLRPSWFMQNFSESHHVATIATDRAIYSATGQGKIAFVDADDIAKAAYGTLTMDTAANREYVLTGPTTLSYNQVAETISNAAGYSVRHILLSAKDLTARYVESGLPEMLSQTLAGMDELISTGVEDRTTQDVLAACGEQAGSFEQYAKGSAKFW